MSLALPSSSGPDVVSALREAGCVFAEDEARLLLAQARTPEELTGLVGRRVRGEPLEQILGWAEFAGLRVAVEPGVFVPRRRTELLVTKTVDAVRALRAHGRQRPVVVDLCCGSGAVAAAVVARLGDVDPVELHAADVDGVAVRCARRNLAGLAGVHEGDLFAALPSRLAGAVDVLAASPPYVPSDAVPLLPPEAREHEPLVALDGGADGLDVVRRVVGAAPDWIRSEGVLLFDLGEDQAPAALDLLRGAGFGARTTGDDDLGATVVVGVRDPRPEPGAAAPLHSYR
jgi:release factor glutamine methyltransferase